VQSVLLFGLPEEKDEEVGSVIEDGIVQRAARAPAAVSELLL
jgi:hypothetical protein